MNKEYITLAGTAAQPYSDIVIVENQLFLSGLIPQDETSGELLKGDIEFETDIVLRNMSHILERYGSGMDKVIKVDVFLHDFCEKDRMNSVYVKHFPTDKFPARVCVGGIDLAADCKVEMVATALR